MGKTLIACDLDNTLIFPASKKREGDICAEHIDGKEQSFISPGSLEALEKINALRDAVFLPVTSRSREQYLRICLPESCTARHALVCNGAVLLNNGVPDGQWEMELMPYVTAKREETERLYEKYRGFDCFTSIRIVDSIFLFAACRDRRTAEELYSELKKETSLDLFLSGRKLYWFYEGTGKGENVKRYAEKNGFDRVIAAGDSLIDRSMLAVSDIALAPDEGLVSGLDARSEICGGEDFARLAARRILYHTRRYQ